MRMSVRQRSEEGEESHASQTNKNREDRFYLETWRIIVTNGIGSFMIEDTLMTNCPKVLIIPELPPPDIL